MPAIPKPRPKLLDKRQAKADVLAEDRRENAKVRARSKGLCEVITIQGQMKPYLRCMTRAAHVHHLMSGLGRRNRGDSIKAEHKLHVCCAHHEDIHGHVLKRTNEMDRYDAARIRFQRVT